eukprot:TRINITY_DN8689_c0_g1_i2.p1 TRINITY_DN8689_c0_g1~~TRINITY_DN8689_c0_g1_i2.p1  ORF type:complete len:353 (+),score=114.19 TRINITY_DN8689_c0_g1_i2:893-1951(+)
MAQIEMNMKQLVSVLILEKDNNGDVLPVWAYPEVSQETQDVFIARSGLEQEAVPLQFSFSRFKQEWLYIFIGINSDNARVPAFAIGLVATDFNPEKWAAATRMIAGLYAKTSSPPKVLESFLAIFTRASYNPGAEFPELSPFVGGEYEPKASLLASSIKAVVNLFGEEVILLWHAIVLKKRVVVVSSKLSALLQLIRAFPLFAFHRGNWNFLRPYVTRTEAEEKDLKSTAGYVAGFTDPSIVDDEAFYDVLVDVNNRSISVSSGSQGDFRMTSMHKDFCEFMVNAAANEDVSETDFIKAITVKTKNLISKLESLKGDDGLIELDTLRNTPMPPNMDRFLISLATAEGMMKSS